jgi:hypothetical protein
MNPRATPPIRKAIGACWGNRSLPGHPDRLAMLIEEPQCFGCGWHEIKGGTPTHTWNTPTPFPILSAGRTRWRITHFSVRARAELKPHVGRVRGSLPACRAPRRVGGRQPQAAPMPSTARSSSEARSLSSLASSRSEGISRSETNSRCVSEQCAAECLPPARRHDAERGQQDRDSRPPCLTAQSSSRLLS